MNKVWIILLTALSIPCFAMPRGAYLIKPAATRDQIVFQYTRNSSVQQAYDKVFHMPQSEIRSTLMELKQKRLTESHVMKVYYLRHGRTGYQIRRVRKNTKVWILPDGTPILIAKCGNPIKPIRPFVEVIDKVTSIPPPVVSVNIDITMPEPTPEPYTIIPKPVMESVIAEQPVMTYDEDNPDDWDEVDEIPNEPLVNPPTQITHNRNDWGLLIVPFLWWGGDNHCCYTKPPAPPVPESPYVQILALGVCSSVWAWKVRKHSS